MHVLRLIGVGGTFYPICVSIVRLARQLAKMGDVDARVEHLDKGNWDTWNMRMAILLKLQGCCGHGL